MRELTDIPPKLLRDLAEAPVVPESQIDRLVEDGGYLLKNKRQRPTLTEQELRALQCLSHGMTYDQAAEVIGISRETIQVYLKRARYKLIAKNTTQAVAMAIRLGLIP